MLRPSRLPLRIAGPDAPKFLFDVLTARIRPEPGPGFWWALLSPQGKIQAEGLCSWVDDAFMLDVATGVADAFIRKLGLYKLRAALEIKSLADSHVVGWSRDGLDPRGAGLGGRVIAPRAEAADWADGEAAFRAARLAFGLMELGPDFAPDSAFPHDIGMDVLGGVDFNKGCYIGQEVVSRMQHRGTARRRPVLVEGLPHGTAAFAPVMVGTREAGTIGTPEGGIAVASIRLDRVPDAGAATVAGQPVRLRLPDWAPYRFGETPVEDEASPTP
jgi:folate-binding protein YgfZ